MGLKMKRTRDEAGPQNTKIRSARLGGRPRSNGAFFGDIFGQGRASLGASTSLQLEKHEPEKMKYFLDFSQ